MYSSNIQQYRVTNNFWYFAYFVQDLVAMATDFLDLKWIWWHCFIFIVRVKQQSFKGSGHGLLQLADLKDEVTLRHYINSWTLLSGIRFSQLRQHKLLHIFSYLGEVIFHVWNVTNDHEKPWTKGFLVISGSIVCGQQHTKNHNIGKSPKLLP